MQTLWDDGRGSEMGGGAAAGRGGGVGGREWGLASQRTWSGPAAATGIHSEAHEWDAQRCVVMETKHDGG